MRPHCGRILIQVVLSRRSGIMKNVGMISVTLNAVNPMMKLFSEKAVSQNPFTVINYLDEGLQELVAKEGKVTDKSLSRMKIIIENAIQDGAEIILLTCTVFSPFIDLFNKSFSVPVISVDGAMLDKAAAMNRSTAILCTFPATVETSKHVFMAAAKKQGVDPRVDIFLLEDAARANKAGNKEDHDRIIAREAEKMSSGYDLIVLAQISMAGAKAYIKDCSKPVLTSPECVFAALENSFPE